MTRDEQIDKVIYSLSEVQVCNVCGVRLRFGDIDCPHCGADIEDILRVWAGQLLDSLAGAPDAFTPHTATDKYQSRKDS